MSLFCFPGDKRSTGSTTTALSKPEGTNESTNLSKSVVHEENVERY